MSLFIKTKQSLLELALTCFLISYCSVLFETEWNSLIFSLILFLRKEQIDFDANNLDEKVSVLIAQAPSIGSYY